MIRFENITIRLNGFTMEGIDFHVPTGTYAVLMGRTGCGKTTLLEAVCGLRPIETGRIYLMGRDVTALPPGKRNLGLVPQDAALFSTMTVESHLAFALNIRKRPRREIRQSVHEMASWLGIDHLLDRYPSGLSGGERQRVAIGRALTAGPDVLCLDEPLSALDEQTHTEMIDLLRQVHRQTGVTVLHVTHNRHEAHALAETLMLVRDGKVVADRSFKAHETAGRMTL
jgi:molybdate/tungstate transport system ATP-binding protein